MGKHVRHLLGGDDRKPSKAAPLDEPLDFIHEDHLREREICALLDKIAEGVATPGMIVKEAIHFLTVPLPLHLKDEEKDLFPLLRRRCAPEDNIGKIITRLLRDHEHANDDTSQIVALLETLIDRPHRLAAAETSALTGFVSHARRHLILENAIILPFARLRLTEDDLETLSLRMCQRRNIASLKEIKHAR